MAAAQQSQDSADCMIPLQPEIVVENNASKSVNTKEQILSCTNENTTTSVARGASFLKPPKGVQEKASFLGKGGEQPFYQPNVYAPQPQTFYAGGYMNPLGQWEEYPHYVNMEGLHPVSPGIYSDNQSIMLSPGYANNPQMMYGAYSPAVGDGQPYYPLNFPFSSPYYQPPPSPSMGYSNSASGISQGDPMLPQECFLHDSLLYSPTPGYHQSFGSFDRAPTQQSNAPGLFGQGNTQLATGMHHGSMYAPGSYKPHQQGKFGEWCSRISTRAEPSIKYNVWASTVSGNRKLDSAYRMAKEKEGHCPIFLFFSVNGSGQFCGVAEMTGPVDFDKSVDYWQQDKWSGQFPVKWHIIKDVPNNLLRHIILDNNDNKPVTNSRDTQEVKLEHGLQMLTIFKNHESETTIIADFNFYEQREKALQENRRQKQPAGTEPQKPAENKALGELTAHISDAFARTVQLKETEGSGGKPGVEGVASAGDASTAATKAEDGIGNMNASPVE
ncbi:hypothetical protein GUJ93_ZPchr0010g10069 [Zizania palustris]|uniref:YTH domain-containing family protein n=1 Tax=Zizania palustris TaxID=103762 RepID=A0A8J5WBX0_ZIZPA|nr:hypothetical protein GUJ93_ZPchr0010g10069 [Zizania palustris]